MSFELAHLEPQCVCLSGWHPQDWKSTWAGVQFVQASLARGSTQKQEEGELVPTYQVLATLPMSVEAPWGRDAVSMTHIILSGPHSPQHSLQRPRPFRALPWQGGI